MRLAAVYLSALFFGLCLIGVIGFEILMRSRVDPVIAAHRETQKKYYQTYLDDLEFVDKFPIFAKFGNQADGGPLLSKKLTWIPALPEQKDQPPLVPANVREQILRSRHEWVERYDRYNKLKFDLSFFKDAMVFDHWNLEATGPIAALVEKGHFVPPPVFPVADPLEISILARLRLMQVMKPKDQGRNKERDKTATLEALKEVRHMAVLLLSTENFSLYLAGISLFEIERKAYRHFVDTRALDEGDWTPINRNLTRRAHRALWATRGYLRIWTDPEILRDLFLNRPKAPFGLCASVNEALPNELALRPLLYDHVPFERDYRNSYKLIMEIFEKSKASCRLHYLQALLKKRNLDVEYPMPWILTSLPYSRKVYGLQMSANGFVGFDGYESSKRK